MSARRSRRSQPATPRRSLRLQGQKDLPFDYQRPTTFMDLDVATPRYLFKKVLQTQPIISPLVPAQPRCSQPEDSVLRLPLSHSPRNNLETNSANFPTKENLHSAQRLPMSQKSLSERGVDNQLDSDAQSALENMSLTKSLSFRTPAPLEPAAKKGLLRRPKNYRSINMKDFQEGIDENLQHVKELQSDLLDSVLNDTEKHSVSTKLFAHPQLSGQDEEEASIATSQHASVVQSLTGEGTLPSENSSRKHLNTEMDPVISSTPVHHKVQDVQSGCLPMLFHEKSARRSVKKMVSHLIEELDKSISEANREEQEEEEEEQQQQLFPNEGANQISQRTTVETPGSCVSRRNTKELKNPPATQIVDGSVSQQMGKGSELQEMLDMQTEPEAETEPESEEMTDPETDFENVDPTEKTPAFVRARAFDCIPLLAAPHTLKVDASSPSPKEHNAKRAPMPSRKPRRTKNGPELPSSLIKKLFSHYVQMPVSKDAFKVVERSVNRYFKHLSDDLEAFTKHAGRKTTEPADMELLMRRQGLITKKKPLNVLIEQHMPLEYRKLLLPVATSGNKVVPSKRK